MFVIVLRETMVCDIQDLTTWAMSPDKKDIMYMDKILFFLKWQILEGIDKILWILNLVLSRELQIALLNNQSQNMLIDFWVWFHVCFNQFR